MGKRLSGAERRARKRLAIKTSFRGQAAMLNSIGKVGRTKLRVIQEYIDPYNDLRARNAAGLFYAFLCAEPTISQSKANELVLSGQPRATTADGKNIY